MDNIIVVNGVGNAWDEAKHYQLVRYIKACHKRYNKLGKEQVITISSLLFTYDEIGDYLESLIKGVTDSDLPIKQTLNTLKSLVSTVKVYDYIEVFRSVILKVAGKKMFSPFVRLNTLILSAYNYGRLEGVDNIKREAYFSDNVDPLDVSTMLDLELMKRKLPALKLIGLVPMNGSEQKLYKNLFKQGNSAELRKFYSSIGSAHLQLSYKTVPMSMAECYVSNLFQEKIADSLPINDLSSLRDRLSMSMFKLETGKSYTFEIMVHLILKHHMKVDILKDRKFFINEEGIAIHFKPSKDTKIVQLHIKEVHIERPCEQHYLACSYITEAGVSRMVPIHINNIKKTLDLCAMSEDLEVILILLKWFGVVNNLELPRDSSIIENLQLYVEEESDRIFESLNIVITSVNNALDNIVSPENHHYTKPGSTNDIVDKEQLVTTVEKLPEGEALTYVNKLLAEEYSINVPEGYTLCRNKTEELEKVI